MKPTIRTLSILLIVLAALLLSGCVAIPLNQAGLVIGTNYRLESGETLDSDLTILGGNAMLDTGSTVNGDMVVIGGNATVDGKILGDLSVMGGNILLDSHADIAGSVQATGGSVKRSPGATVEGRDLGDTGRPGRITTLDGPVKISYEPVTATLMAIFQALALAALAIIVCLFALRPMNRVGQTAIAQAPVSGGVGCLTLIVLVIMAITIILLPVSLLGFLAVGIAALFGWTALGLILGRRLAVWLKQPWTDPVSAGVGTLVLSLFASLINIIPCVGWLASFAITMIGIGAVVLSRFGTQPYPAFPPPQPPVPAAPYSPPPSPSTGAEIYSAPEPPTDDRPGM